MRDKKFSDIKGHERAIESLRKDIGNKHFASTYLFCGPEGIGKFLTAKTFAAGLNCLNATSDLCNNCISCLKIQNDQHPDVHIINNGYTSEIKIEEIRQLQEDISLRPYEARVKVFIINDAHNLNSVSANAFLKTLEEPNKDNVIILISDKSQLLLKTIVSRCRIVRFYPLAQEEINGILKNDYKIDDRLIRYLAYFCEGRLGAVLRLKDKDILRQKNQIIDGFIKSGDSVFSQGSGRPGLGQSGSRVKENSLKQDRNELRDSLMVLTGWVRDIYLLKAGLPQDKLINLDRRQELLELINCYSFSELDEILKTISDSLLYLEQNANINLLSLNLKTTILARR